MRLDNFLSKALSITRTEASKVIKDNLIKVNNKCVIKKDFKINEDIDTVSVNGEIVTYKAFVYYMLNKPQGVVSAVHDKIDKTVVDLIDTKREIFPVGRLDKDTEGLLILTNNGKYAHLTTSPSHHVVKKYYVELEKDITEDDKYRFCNGLEIKDGKDEIYTTKDANLDILTNNTCYVYISEGKFHQIKRMFEKLDNRVVFLKRISFGDITLDEDLKPGEYRELTDEEIKKFKIEK